MSKWGKDIIGSVFLIIRNGASIKQGDVEGGYPITRIETIANGVVDKEKLGYAGINDVNKYKNYILESGDILMSHINSEKHLGKTAIYMKADNEIIIHGMNLLLLRPNYKKITSKFAFYFFQSASFKNQIPRITKKSVNQASFTVTALKELSIPLPPLEEQKRIADILDKASKLIDLRKQQLEKMDLLVKSKFIDMFGDQVTNPKGWELVRLGEGMRLQGGYAFRSADYVENGIKLVQIANVNKDKLTWNETNYLPVSFLGKYSNFTLKNGDIVLAMTRPIIKSLEAVKVAIVSNTDLPCLLNQRVGRFVVDKNKFNEIFIFTLCKFPFFKNAVEKFSGNSLQPNVSSAQVESIKVYMPPLELQKQFVAFVEQVEKQKAVMQQSLEKMETNYKALMQQYFG